MWFLNGRPLRDRVLSRVLKEGYRGFLVEGRQPVAFLALSIDPAAVDVNVHPAKAEVRFRDERRLFGFLVNHLREAVRSTDMATPGERLSELAQRREAREAGVRHYSLPLPPPSQQRAREDEAPWARPAALREPAPAAPPRHEHRHVHDHDCAHAAPPRAAADARADDLAGPYLRVARTYIVRATPDGFEVLDQHALHERLTFERLKAEYAAGGVEVQRRLVPELVEVSPAQARLVEEHLEALARAGLELARFGERTIAVHGLPARLKRVDVEALVREAIEGIERAGATPGALEVVEEVLHSAACRASVMAGDELDDDEIRALLETAREAATDQTCPHARPTRVRFTLADLERAFHRR